MKYYFFMKDCIRRKFKTELVNNHDLLFTEKPKTSQKNYGN